MSSGGPLATKGVHTGKGVTVATKGMVSSSEAADGAGGLQGEPLVLPIPRLPIRIIIPTAANSALMVVENIFDNLRVQQASNIAVPSMYKRAYLVAYETDETAVVTP
jgi:hypothetical protein